MSFMFIFSKFNKNVFFKKKKKKDINKLTFIKFVVVVFVLFLLLLPFSLPLLIIVTCFAMLLKV